MNARLTRKRSLFLAAGLTAALAATTALSAPRMLGADAMQPPTAAELGLSPAHAKRWDALRAEAVALRQIGREDLRDGVGELRTLLDQPSPDLRAFSRESQRKVDAHMAEARALRERQLDLYESLTPDEQARVRRAMAERLDRFARIRERIAAFVEARG
ncbi:MAG: hypothetical protein ACOY82_16515 [Pseudomonadota bacterium]